MGQGEIRENNTAFTKPTMPKKTFFDHEAQSKDTARSMRTFQSFASGGGGMTKCSCGENAQAHGEGNQIPKGYRISGPGKG